MEVATHHAIVRRLCGEPVDVETGRAVVRLQTVGEMVVDAHGLIHGGFIFGAADYAAMVAVNDPNVVLGSAEVRFTAPVRVQQVVDFEARVVNTEGKKHLVEVEGRVGNRTVFRGTFTCFVPDRYVLDSAE
jgi:acyl-coenzyme A thioesterase PaaI-like protein